MRWLLVLALAGCENVERYPANPGGGGGGTGSSMRRDAATDDSDAEGTVTGRVCLIADDSSIETCPNAGAGGIAVSIGTATTQTAADGRFTLERMAGDTLLRVQGAQLMPSARVVAGTNVVSVFRQDLYEQMLATTQPAQAAGDGAIVVRVTRAAVPQPGFTATASPNLTSEVYYDGVGLLAWDLDATDAFGAIWIPSIGPGSATVTVSDGATTKTLDAIPVLADTVTFVYADIL